MGAALLLALALAGGGRFDRANSRTEQGRSARGFMSSSGALFEFAPASGAGIGTACACAAVTGSTGEALTVARATVAECPSPDGQTLTQCPANRPVITTGRTDRTVLGLLHQPTRGNYAVHSRDLSQAAWTKTSMTCARTATGMRLDANGASRCESTVAGGSVVQSITLASGARSASFRIRRVTGTGAVEVTLDGSTWYAAPGLSSGTSWVWVTSLQTVGCAPGCAVVSGLSATLANPSIGIRLAELGDVVDVDFVQLEDGAFPTVPIETGAAAAARDVDYVYGSAVVGAVSTGCAAMMLVPQATDGVRVLLATDPGTAWPLEAEFASGVLRSWDGTSEPTTSWQIATGGVSRVRVTWQGSARRLTAAPGTSSVVAFDGSMTSSVLQIGNLGAGAYSAAGVISELVYDSSPTRCTAPVIDWLGDSIVAGTGSAPDTPPVQLAPLVGASVVNGGVGGNTTAQCAARWTSTYRALGDPSLAWSCAVNDVATGITGAVAAANVQAVVLDALSLGARVTVTSIMPWKNSAGWTAGKQAESDSYDSLMAAWCASGRCTFVDTSSLGGGGGDPDVLAAAYDSGDHIHPNAAGAGAFAALVAAAAP